MDKVENEQMMRLTNFLTIGEIEANSLFVLVSLSNNFQNVSTNNALSSNVYI